MASSPEHADPVLFDRSPVKWLIMATGIVSVLYAIKTRQPWTTSDFTTIYESAARPAADMYQGPRVNLNPPQFSVIVQPLTALRMSVAAEIWRALNVLSLSGCLWWLALHSDEKWSVADIGAVLVWAPFHHAFTLNQVTWIMWPLLIAAWWHWRNGRWTAGAVWFGVALSMKLFLGVFLIWLAMRRQWKPIVTTVSTASVAFLIGIAAYGAEAFRGWIGALGAVSWTATWTNASIRGMLLRLFTKSASGAVPFANVPKLVDPVVLVLAILLVIGTCVICRNRSVDDSWPALMASALLASPLGWLYYTWWILPGLKPSRLLVRSPVLWLPLMFVVRGQPSRWATLTYASMFTWGLLIAWMSCLAIRRHPKAKSTGRSASFTMPADCSA